MQVKIEAVGVRRTIGCRSETWRFLFSFTEERNAIKLITEFQWPTLIATVYIIACADRTVAWHDVLSKLLETFGNSKNHKNLKHCIDMVQVTLLIVPFFIMTKKQF